MVARAAMVGLAWHEFILTGDLSAWNAKVAPYRKGSKISEKALSDLNADELDALYVEIFGAVPARISEAM